MDNYVLLEKYRKKMSLYFTIFVLLSIWIIIGFFEASQYMNQNIKDEIDLEKKYEQISNVLKNKNIYKEAKEITLRKVINKILENSIIMLDGKVLINTIDGVNNINEFKKDTYINKLGYKFLNKDTIDEKGNIYNVLTRIKQKISIEDLKSNYIHLFIITIPFSILFFIIGYIFVGKNLRPIKENIKNLQDFTGNINHEFKTPLTEIISSLELAKKTGKYKNAIEQSINSSKKINNILNSLVGLININSYSYKNEKVNIIAFLKEVIKSYETKAKDKNIKVIFNSKITSKIKNIDKQHLHICLSNIISNAIKYSNKNGEVNISIRGNTIKVIDHGEGIDKKNLDKIFDRYFRESYVKEGAGVGLSLVKKICDTNGWNIKIRSKKGEGTEVSFTIS